MLKNLPKFAFPCAKNRKFTTPDGGTQSAAKSQSLSHLCEVPPRLMKIIQIDVKVSNYTETQKAKTWTTVNTCACSN